MNTYPLVYLTYHGDGNVGIGTPPQVASAPLVMGEPVEHLRVSMTEDLLRELEWQIEERIRIEREACAKACEDIPLPKDSKALTHLPTIERCATAIRARGEK
jgi:hypothetical protein